MYKSKLLCAVLIVAGIQFAHSQSANDPTRYVTGNSAKPDSTNEIFTIVEEMPYYVGGEDALKQFLIKNIAYPQSAIKDSVMGKVFVNFVVNEEGKIENAKILRGLTDDINAEALRVINMMPTWKPGVQRGKPVKVAYNLPISFQLKK